MIGPLADDHLGHQPRTGQTAGNRLGRLAGQHHVLLDERQAALGQLLFAGVFLADMHHHEQRRGPPIELLAGLRRQLDQILQAAQCRLLGFGKIVNDFLTLGLVGNPPSAALVAVLGSCPCDRRRRVGSRLFRICLVLEQHALLRIELLAAAPVNPFQQQVNVMFLPLEPLVAQTQLLQQLHDQLLEHRDIVGQQGGIGKRHGVRVHALIDTVNAKLFPPQERFFSPHQAVRW